MLTKEIYSNYRANTFEIPNKMLGVVVNLFESHNLAVPKTVKNFKGLQNLGNTCYMNSLLQCLFLTKTFRKELLNLRYSMKEIDQNQLIGEFFRLFSNLSELDLSNEKYLVPVEMKNSLPEPFCSSYQQQDSCEFSRLILEEIENQLNKIYKDKVILNI